jgi:hypothetical protein
VILGAVLGAVGTYYVPIWLRPDPTVHRVFSFDSGGVVNRLVIDDAVGGRCFPRSFRNPQAAANACLTRDGELLDPCYLIALALNQMACFDSPWHGQPSIAVIARRIGKDGPEPRIRYPQQPWALELANELRCVASPFRDLESTPSPAGTTHICNPPSGMFDASPTGPPEGWVIGGVQTSGELWQVEYRDGATSATTTVDVLVEWK